MCLYRKTTSLRSSSTSSVLSYHSLVGTSYFSKPKIAILYFCTGFLLLAITLIIVFSALAEINVDCFAVFALVFAIDSYPTLTSIIRCHKNKSLSSKYLLIDSAKFPPQKLPKEKRQLWYFVFYNKVDNNDIRPLPLKCCLHKGFNMIPMISVLSSTSAGSSAQLPSLQSMYSMLPLSRLRA